MVSYRMIPSPITRAKRAEMVLINPRVTLFPVVVLCDLDTRVTAFTARYVIIVI